MRTEEYPSRRIHAILSIDENIAADKFISDHMKCYNELEGCYPDFIHTFTNKGTKAEFTITCTGCGLTCDLTKFNDGDERQVKWNTAEEYKEEQRRRRDLLLEKSSNEDQSHKKKDKPKRQGA